MHMSSLSATHDWSCTGMRVEFSERDQPWVTDNTLSLTKRTDQQIKNNHEQSRSITPAIKNKKMIVLLLTREQKTKKKHIDHLKL